MRAREPDESGYVERDGVRSYYEIHGSGEPTVLLLPTWSIVHSRHWKMQVPYLARHCRVLLFDGRGNGRSDRPERGYSAADYVADALAVMDATGTERAHLVSLSLGAQRALLLAAEHPERVESSVFICPAVPLGEAVDRSDLPWDEERDHYEGWEKYNRHYWLKDYRGFLEFFFSQMFNEPHSSKAIEDAVGWGLDTTPETLIDMEREDWIAPDEVRELARRMQCPSLVIQGSRDAITGKARGIALAEASGAELVMLSGSGHGPHARDPVKVNLLLRDFIVPPRPPARWARGAARRRKRALYVSSPIGLGHAQRDAAIADELRKLHPELEIDWLAQHPVTTVLEARGERIHPASALLASESRHIESESAEHDLHAFQAIRRMDEILLANFMVFHDVIRDDVYDLWIGDEAW
jgi:pimeloyl-ACP methyl ester carboxylesterase